jgi:2-polyprenyl-3-methyl-5-hydroxy-6-metoxy-1,4-benzoquinol methylase
MKKSNPEKKLQKFGYNYTTIYLKDQIIEGKRDPMLRIKSIPIDFTGKSVLDIGCNVGGMLFALSSKISTGYGYDVNHRAIETANDIVKKNNIDNLFFEQSNLENYKDINFPKTDVVLMLSIAVWISTWKDIINKIKPSLLIFESHGKMEDQKDQLDFLNEKFNEIIFIETEEEHGRKLYLCK